MKSYHDEGVKLLNKFIQSVDTEKNIYQGLSVRKDITHALALLQEGSGILRNDYPMAKLCADCFMLGVFIATPYPHHNSHDRLIEVLRGMKLTATEANEAADYARQNVKDSSEPELLRTALQYHGTQKV